MKSLRPRICLVSPAARGANNGNWHTAQRWQRFLAAQAQVDIALAWDGAPTDALIALHARRSADSVARFHAAHAGRALALVLTGTDLYRDLGSDRDAQHALACASHLVVLQPEALHRLAPAERAKARVIVQSAPQLLAGAARRRTDFVAVGHLRAEKDPLTLLGAVRALPAATPIRIVHVGNALEDALGAAARLTAAQCSHYRWIGGVSHAQARRWIARAGALVQMSRIEGGANVVVEALRSGVAVLASRIDGNVGLLGRDYDGYFEPGDAPALAALLQRFAADAAFAAKLGAQCAALEPRFAPALEHAAVAALCADLLAVVARNG